MPGLLFLRIALTVEQAEELDILDADGKARRTPSRVPEMDAILTDAVEALQDEEARERLLAEEREEQGQLHVGKDDPIMIVRCQSGLPAVGEVLEPFANPHYVAGWMRGSHNGPLMPCALTDSTPARFDGAPRVVAMGFQLADGHLVGPRDLLAYISFDRARQQALEMAD